MSRGGGGGGSELEGYCVDLISELSKALGFRYKLSLVKDNRYGAMDASGAWSGMIGEVIRGVRLLVARQDPCGGGGVCNHIF